MDSVLKSFLCTEPADRPRAEQIIREFHGRVGLPDPQIIWCGSPQTAIVIAKIVNDLHEASIPVRPDRIQGGGRQRNGLGWPRMLRGAVLENAIRDRQVTAAFELGDTDVRMRQGFVQGFFMGANSGDFDGFNNTVGSIAQALIQSFEFNPDTTLFREEGGRKKDGDLVERALNNTEPHLSEIKLSPGFYGTRLRLEAVHLGQASPSRKDTPRGLRMCCGWAWDFGTHVFASERFSEIHTLITSSFVSPGVGRVERRVLHNPNGAAARWPDGTEVYFINGVRVPDFVVTNPEKITRYKINREFNQEVRRIMMDRYKFGQYPSGVAAYVKDSGAKVLDHDERFGTLYRLLQEGDEPIHMLEVVNRSPEPDGSFKRYYLRVPPSVTTSRVAAAWTFGFEPGEAYLYRPLQET